MAEGFVPLASLLRGPGPGPGAFSSGRPLAAAPLDVPEPAADAGAVRPEGLLGSIAGLRLAALEAFERGAERLLAALAEDVLARELRLAPADVERLVARALEAFASSEPVAVEVSGVDAGLFDGRTPPCPVRIDPALGPGDVVVRVRDGAFESPFALRLARTIAAASLA